MNKYPPFGRGLPVKGRDGRVPTNQRTKDDVMAAAAGIDSHSHSCQAVQAEAAHFSPKHVHGHSEIINC